MPTSVIPRECLIHSPGIAIDKEGIVYLPEDRLTEGLCMRRSIMHNMHLSSYDRFKKNGKGAMDLVAMEEETNKWVAKFHIVVANIHNAIRTLSGGNAQKVLFSRWMNADPKVLIVDEPTAGVDVGAKAEIHKLLRNMAKQGVAVILISSDLSEVFAVSDRILVMREGRIVDEVATSEATQEGILEKGLIG